MGLEMKNKVKLLLYCTKSKPNLLREFDSKKIFVGITSRICELHRCDKEYGMNCEYERYCCEHLNGKIVAMCDCDKLEEISCRCVSYFETDNCGYKAKWKGETISVVFKYKGTMFKNEELNQMCLTPQQLLDYIKLGNNGYALHLSNLEIFDEPKELRDYGLKRAPQNMCRCYDKDGNEYFLLSIRPEHLVHILNGRKTIEIRKRVLLELLCKSV